VKLHHLKPAEGAKKSRTRVGRGRAGRGGRRAGRGWRGGGARHTPQVGFEGGQMPLFRRLPKRGFNNARFATTYIPVNVESLNSFDDGARVDETVLRGCGLANGKSSGGIKILGDGKLTKKLTVVADAFSASARQQIEALGGACEAPPVVPKVPRARTLPAPKAA